MAIANKSLPFWQLAPEMISLLLKDKRCILVAPTGLGKTTQAPQALDAAGFTCHEQGEIYVSVPKRVLAIELSSRVAEEMGVKLGTLVGYQIRGERVGTRTTRIWFLTEGMLRAKILANPHLDGISVVVFDEFHQRSLMSDLNVALVERAQQEGAKVAFLLMSATVDPTYLANHFACQVVDGSHLAPLFPVEERYCEPERDLFSAAAQQAADLLSEQQGNGLIFMPGKAEIEQCINALQKLLPKEGVTILPMHGDLDAEARHAPFASRPGVTITVSTDIVETGATLPKIGWVIDSGLAREVGYDPISDLSSLRVRAVAKDRLKQRRGRAGREKVGNRAQSGKYVGLFSRENYQQRAERTQPEIFRVPLRAVVLTLKALGLSREGNPVRLIDTPEKTNWKEAKKQLQLLQLAETSALAPITALGQKAVELGCDPREAVMLLQSVEEGCLQEAAIAIAGLQSKRLLYRPKNEEEGRLADLAHQQFRTSTTCDAWSFIEVFRAEERRGEESLSAWCKRHFVSYPALQEVRQNMRQLLSTMRGLGFIKSPSEVGTEEALRKAILAGIPDRFCTWQGGSWYESADGENLTLARESGIRPGEMVAAWEIREISTRRGGRMGLITNAVVVPVASSEETVM